MSSNQWDLVLREAVAEARNPVMLFSAGKDSTAMTHPAFGQAQSLRS